MKGNKRRPKTGVKVFVGQAPKSQVLSKQTDIKTGSNGASVSEKVPQKWKSWLDKNLVSIVISILALGVAAHSGYATRAHNRLSVRPHMSFNFKANDKGTGWVLTSSGAGPAIVNAFEVTVDGKPVQTWDAFLQALGIDLQGNKYEFSIPIPGTHILPRADATITLLWVDPAARAALVKNLARVQLKLVYCSLYDECWERTSSATQLEPISVPKRKPILDFGASQGWIDRLPRD